MKKVLRFQLRIRKMGTYIITNGGEVRSYKFPSKIWRETCKEGHNNSPEVLPPMTVSRVHIKTRR